VKQLDQEYIDEKADELSFLVEETGRLLNEYHKGNISENKILRTVDKAGEKYEQLDERLDEAFKRMDSMENLDNFLENLESSGYNDLEGFISGSAPPTASVEGPKEEALNKLTEDSSPEFEQAFDVIEDYSSLIMDLNKRYGIDAKIPEHDGDEEIERIMQEDNITGDSISAEDN
jgi:hypothetical protein